MFTKNFELRMISGAMRDGLLTGSKAVDYTGVEKTLYSNVSNVATSFSCDYCMGRVLTSLNTASPGVCFGDGTTPVTKNDYKLSGNIITTISTSVNKTFTSDDDNGGGTLSAVYTITNTGNNAITISEIGLFNYWYHTNYSNYSTFLLERTLLDRPITIEAGGVGQVTYSISTKYPT